jgi:putative ABC transport system permease protein
MRLVLWNLRHRRQRLLLNMIVIAITTAVLILFTSVFTKLLGEARRARNAAEARITIETQLGGNDLSLPLTMERVFREIDGVKDVVAFQFASGGTEEEPYTLYGVTESWADRPDTVFSIDPAARAAWKREAPQGALVSAEAAKQLNLQPGKLAELTTEYGPMQVIVSAVGPSMGEMFFVVHLRYLNERSPNPGNALFRIITAAADFLKVSQAIEEHLARSGRLVTPLNENQFRLEMLKEAAAIPIFFGFLGVFLVITAGLTLANNSAISIRERRAQIATLRVIGFKSRSLLWSIMAEVMTRRSRCGRCTQALVRCWRRYRCRHSVVRRNPDRSDRDCSRDRGLDPAPSDRCSTISFVVAAHAARYCLA